MKERGILYSGPMILAQLDGRKTQTRRMIKPQPPSIATITKRSDGDWLVEKWPRCEREMNNFGRCENIKCPYGEPGDVLYAKETHYLSGAVVKYGIGRVRYRADDMIRTADGEFSPAVANEPKWRPSIFMPKWASRVRRIIGEVRVERLQDITPEDAIAEGALSYRHIDHFDRVVYGYSAPVDRTWRQSPVDAYMHLWEKINGPGSWEKNPWVWVLAGLRSADVAAAGARGAAPATL